MNIPSVTKQETVEEVTETSTPGVTQNLEVTETPEVTQDLEITDTLDVNDQDKHESVEGAFTGSDRIPANWNIQPTEDGIEAFNSTSGNRFNGTIAEFNAKLKG